MNKQLAQSLTNLTNHFTNALRGTTFFLTLDGAPTFPDEAKVFATFYKFPELRIEVDNRESFDHCRAILNSWIGVENATSKDDVNCDLAIYQGVDFCARLYFWHLPVMGA